MEIIAKKNSGLVVVYLLAALASAFAAGYLAFLFFGDDGRAYEIGMGIVFLFAFLFCIIKAIILIKPPYVIIIYENGLLRFADGLQCTPYELEQVHYRRRSARGIQYSTGTLTVTVNGEEHRYTNIGDVVEVHDRLIELMAPTKK